MIINKRSPTDVDQLIAARIVMGRKAIGMSQENLAAGLGITFQQVQKYSTGANRVSASRLYMIASALGVPISYFFKDVDNAIYGVGMVPHTPDLITEKMNRLLRYKDVQRILELDYSSWTLAVLPVIKALINRKGNQRGEESNEETKD